jgi:hypothetical protein
MDASSAIARVPGVPRRVLITSSGSRQMAPLFHSGSAVSRERDVKRQRRSDTEQFT